MSERSVSELYYEHVKELERRADSGDEFAMKSLSCLALVCEGWRYGDPDPEDGPDHDPDGGEKIINLSIYRMRIAA